MIRTIFLVLFSISIITTIKSSSPESDTYFVGLVECFRKMDGTPKETLEFNMNGYRELLEKYVKPGDKVDLIAFPEVQLNEAKPEVSEYIPDPKEHKILCDKNHNESFVSELSCWAAKYKKYMVFNVFEKADCTEQDEFCRNNLWEYNTNIVFDRNGALIARYRKHYIYVERGIKPTKIADLVAFETDFGVTFGTFICFDLLFYDPAIMLVNENITDFIFTTMWDAELPFLAAHQIEFGWSYANDVNFLASGGNSPSIGSSGTGALGGKSGTIKYKIWGETHDEMLIIEVPKKKNLKRINSQPNRMNQPKSTPNRLKGFKIMRRDNSIDLFKTVDLKFTELDNEIVNQTVCYNDFCCHFEVSTIEFDDEDDLSFYSYKLGAFSDKKKWFDYLDSWAKICTIFNCTDSEDFSTCGTLFNDDVEVVNKYVFTYIKIEADFDSVEKMIILPSTLNQNMKALEVDEFGLYESSKGNQTNVVMELLKPNTDFLTFGILAIYYDGFESK